jgi:hypothetical protein
MLTRKMAIEVFGPAFRREPQGGEFFGIVLLKK